MMTLIFPRSTRVLAGALAAALTLSLLSTASHARVVTAEQRLACTPDALRLCLSEVPNVERTGACLRAQKTSLSAPCRAIFEKYDR
jgi:hypothetical protein